MNYYPFRIYLEISYIISQKKALSVNAFLQRFDLSPYQTKTDLAAVERLGKHFGLSFSFGKQEISYQVIDEKRFSGFKNDLYNLISLYTYSDREEEMIFLHFHIAYMILSDDESYFRYDEIANRLGYVKSSLRKSFALTRDVFSCFGLSLQSVPHYGVKLVGEEFNIRRALVMVLNWFKMNLVSSVFEEFDSGDYNEKLEKADKVLMESLDIQNSDVRYTDYKRLLDYIVIQNHRMKNNRTVTVIQCDDDISAYFRNSKPLNDLTQQIVSKLEDKCGFDHYSDNEIRSIKVMLVDTVLDSQLIKECIDTLYRHEYEKLFESVSVYFADYYGIQITGYLKQAVENDLNRIIIRKHLNVLTELGINNRKISKYIYSSPLITQMATEVAGLISDFYNLNVPMSQHGPFSEEVYYYIAQKAYSFPALKICVESMSSSLSPYLIKEFLLNKFDSTWIEEVDCYSYNYVAAHYESIRQKYDMVLCDHEPDDKVHECITYADDINEIVKIITMSRDYCQLTLQQHNGKIVSIDYHEDYDYEKAIDCLKKECGIDCLKSLDMLYDDMIIMTCSSHGEIDNLLQFGSINERRYIALVVEFNENNLHFYHQLLYKLANDTAFFDRLKESTSFRTINDVFNRELVISA